MNLPAEKGTYALLFRLNDPLLVAAGKLGACPFQPGQYIYLGSAFGSGGLRARVFHHLKHTRKAHWHVDALSQLIRPCGMYYAVSQRRLECIWCRQIQRTVNAYLPVPGFGAGDCRSGCGAHLLGLHPILETGALRDVLEAVTAGQAVVYQAIGGREN